MIDGFLNFIKEKVNMQDRYSNIISNTCIKKTIIELESKIHF